MSRYIRLIYTSYSIMRTRYSRLLVLLCMLLYMPIMAHAQTTPNMPEKSITLNGFKCYPNPCNNFLQVQYDEKNIGGYYIIFDAIGQRVATDILPPGRVINTSVLSSGVYILLVVNGKETGRAKFVVQKN